MTGEAGRVVATPIRGEAGRFNGSIADPKDQVVPTANPGVGTVVLEPVNAPPVTDYTAVIELMNDLVYLTNAGLLEEVVEPAAEVDLTDLPEGFVIPEWATIVPQPPADPDTETEPAEEPVAETVATETLDGETAETTTRPKKPTRPKLLWEVDSFRLGETMLYETHPVMAAHRAAAETLDDDQRANIVRSLIATHAWSMRERRTPLVVPVKQEEWDTWHTEQAALYADDNPDLAAAFLNQVGQPPRSLLEFRVMRDVVARTEAATIALEEEIAGLSAMTDLSLEDARTAFLDARDRYQSTDRDDRPTVPEWFTRAKKDWYAGTGRRNGRPPLDPATRYALFDVMTNTRRTSFYPRTGRGYVVFDTETTGRDETANIVQITCIAYDGNGQETERLTTYVNPAITADGQDLLNTNSRSPLGFATRRRNRRALAHAAYTGTDEAVAVHGITADQVRNAPTFRDIAPRIRGLLDGRAVVGHNVLFDIGKIQHELIRAGQDPLENIRMIDTLQLARFTQPKPADLNADEPWNYKLSSACARAGITFDPEKAHDSEYDVEMTAAFFFTAKNSLPTE